jgi:hypothetical protein
MCIDHLGIQESCLILIKILLFRRARRVVRRCGGISKLVKIKEKIFPREIFLGLFRLVY